MSNESQLPPTQESLPLPTHSGGCSHGDHSAGAPSHHHHEHHGHHHHGAHQHQAPERIGVAFTLNLCFTLVELVGGLLTNSIAIISDAVHDMGDSLVLGLSWFINRKSKQRGSDSFSFGYDRLRTASALLTGTVLLAGSLLVISRAIPRLLHPEKVNSTGMVLLAILGVLVNGIAALQIGFRSEARVDLKMVALHLLEDLLGWVAVLITAVVLIFTNWYILDPILSIVIALYILVHAAINLHSTLRVLLQATPAHINLSWLEGQILQLIQPHKLHHLHLWSLDGQAHVLTVHLHLSTPESPAQIYQLKQAIRAQVAPLGIRHSTIEVEMTEEECAIDQRQVNCRPQATKEC